MNATPYITRKGELRGVCRQLYKEQWRRYVQSALYHAGVP